MERLVCILKREEKIKSDFKVALAYPLFVLVIGLVSVFFIVTFIMPKVLSSLGGALTLPWATRSLLWFGDMLSSYWFLIGIGATAIYYHLSKYMSSDDGRLFFHRLYLRVPVLGKMLTNIAVGRFSRILGALGRGGVTILESLTVIKGTLGNQVLINEIDLIHEKVKSGKALSSALVESGYFPPLLVQVTAMGEQSGDLDSILLNAAETFEEEADVMIDKLMSLLPALLMIILFIVIGYIVLAILLPIMGMEFAPTGM